MQKFKWVINVVLVFISSTTIIFLTANSLQAQQWTSSADGLLQFAKTSIKKLPNASAIPATAIKIKVDAGKTFQTMEGFGYGLTGGSAHLIHALPKEKRTQLLKEIFGQSEADLGVSYIRISIGASDLDAEVFSYCDLPKGETDSALSHFSLSQDTLHLIPILKEVLAINPSLKIMASPWSPPVWMKTNGISMGGHLLKKYYASYANYFLKYIKAMEANGIKLHSITMQNEPEHGGNNPSLLMNAAEQTEFLRDYLGPQLKAAKINIEVVLFDHNADHPNYPIAILNDAKAKSYAAATAFHLYLGKEEALSEVHALHPDKKIYFTEQWTGAKGSFDGDFLWHLEHIVIGTIQNWSSVVLEWNLANNAKFEPHTPLGCTECKGALTIQDEIVNRNVSYYIIGQIAKFIKPGAIRTLSTATDASLVTTSFNLKNGKKAILILNTSSAKEIVLEENKNYYLINIPAKAASTIIWP
jgi:glucosylceramidase